MSSLGYRNYGGGQSSAINPYAYGQGNQNIEEIDLGTLISPILLKAYNVLKDCELKPEPLELI